MSRRMIHRGAQFRSMRRNARIREADSRDLNRYEPYSQSYNYTVHGNRPNRTMNGRPMGVCNSCAQRRQRRR